MICGSGGSKSRLAKAAGEPLWREAHFQVVKTRTMFGAVLEGQMSKKCTPLWREALFEGKMYKTHQFRPTLGSSDVEKCRCGAKHISNSNYKK